MKRAILCLAAAALLTGQSAPASAGTAVYNLMNDWSDSSNPNSPWSYRSTPTTVLANHLPSWDPPPSGPGWAFEILPSVGHIPVFLRAVTPDPDPRDDFPLGHVYMHDNDNSNSPSGLGDQAAGIFWTAPSSGTIQISGDMWEVTRDLGRSQDWALVVNGQTVSSGTLTPTDATSAAPLDLSAGTGGAAALDRVVNGGDLIGLEFTRHSGTKWGTLMGVDLKVDLTVPGDVIPGQPTPEPSAMIIWTLAASLFVAGGVRRRPGVATP